MSSEPSNQSAARTLAYVQSLVGGQGLRSCYSPVADAHDLLTAAPMTLARAILASAEAAQAGDESNKQVAQGSGAGILYF
jgi:hypothetical protein